MRFYDLVGQSAWPLIPWISPWPAKPLIPAILAAIHPGEKWNAPTDCRYAKRTMSLVLDSCTVAEYTAALPTLSFVSQSVEHRGPALVRRYRRRANAGPRWCADGIRRLMGDLMAQPAITLNTLNTGFSTKMTTLVDQWLLCFPLPFHWRGFLQFAVVVYLGQTHSVVYLGGNLSIGK